MEKYKHYKIKFSCVFDLEYEKRAIGRRYDYESRHGLTIRARTKQLKIF